MKYSAVIDRLDFELRNEEAWPSASDKVDEQINLLYIAALSVFKELPLLRTIHNLTESSSLTPALIGEGDVISRFALPADLFDLREDYGIGVIRLDAMDYVFEQGVSKDSILTIGDNTFHAGNVLFAMDLPNRTMYSIGASDAKIFYVAKFTRPTNDDDVNTDFEALDWPLFDDNDTQRAIHIVAAHVSGSTIRDSANAQFQSLLQEVYR